MQKKNGQHTTHSVFMNVVQGWLAEELLELVSAVESGDKQAQLDAIFDAMGVLVFAISLFTHEEVGLGLIQFADSQVSRGRSLAQVWLVITRATELAVAREARVTATTALIAKLRKVASLG